MLEVIGTVNDFLIRLLIAENSRSIGPHVNRGHTQMKIYPTEQENKFLPHVHLTKSEHNRYIMN